MDANAALQAHANDALDPSLISFAVDSVSAVSKFNEEANKKRSRQSPNGIVKINDIHLSLENLKQVESALGAVKVYLKATSDGTKNCPAVDVLQWSIDELSSERRWISQKLNCTKEKKQSQQAHAKVTKAQRQQAAHLATVAKKSTTLTPRKILLAAWDSVKRLVSKHPVTDASLQPASANVLSESLPRQKKPRQQDHGKTAPIRLPIPADRTYHKYTPKEAIDVYMTFEWNKENLCGSTNKNELRTFMKRVKDEMIEKYLPIQSSRLNELIKNHVGVGKPPPPLESTFDSLGYPEDIDSNGDEHILPEGAIATQTHRQRCVHLNHEEMINLISRASSEIIAAQESTAESIAQEENWRIEQLKGSFQLEHLLYRINGDLSSDLAFSNEPDLLGLFQFPFESREMKKRVRVRVRVR